METTRLRIETLEAAHAAELLASLERSRAHLEPWVDVGRRLTAPLLAARIERWRQAGRATFIARHKDDGGFVGSAGLRPSDGETLEMSYWIDVRYTGQGLGREMAAAVRDLGRAARPQGGVAIVCRADNTRSVQVAGALGFELLTAANGLCRFIDQQGRN